MSKQKQRLASFNQNIDILTRVEQLADGLGYSVLWTDDTLSAKSIRDNYDHCYHKASWFRDDWDLDGFAESVLLKVALHSYVAIRWAENSNMFTQRVFNSSPKMQEFLRLHPKLAKAQIYSAPMTNFAQQRKDLLRRTLVRVHALVAIAFLEGMETASGNELRFFDAPIVQTIPPDIRTIDSLPDAWESMSSAVQIDEQTIPLESIMLNERPDVFRFDVGTVADALKRVAAAPWAKNARLGNRLLSPAYVDWLVEHNPQLSDTVVGVSALDPNKLDRDGDLVQNLHTTSLVFALAKRPLPESLRAHLVQAMLKDQ